MSEAEDNLVTKSNSLFEPTTALTPSVLNLVTFSAERTIAVI